MANAKKKGRGVLLGMKMFPRQATQKCLEMVFMCCFLPIDLTPYFSFLFLSKMETRWDRGDGQNDQNGSLNAGENIFNTSDSTATSGFSGGSGAFYINNNSIEVLSNGHVVHQQDASAMSCDMVEAHHLHHGRANIDCAMQEVCTESRKTLDKEGFQILSYCQKFKYCRIFTLQTDNF